MAQDIPEDQAIKCIMGEARGEPYEGQCAVGEVLRRRGNCSGMYGCFAKFNPDKVAEDKARKAWKESLHSDYSKGATHFEGDAFKRPYWTKRMKIVAHVGSQTFYAKRN